LERVEQQPEKEQIMTAEQSQYSGWKWLYYAGGVAALLAVFFFRRFTGVELVQFNGLGIFEVPDAFPLSAADWFAVLQLNQIIGLVLLGLVDLINYGLVGLIFLALYGALRNTNNGAMTASLLFSLVGITLFFATNQAFALLALSDQYAAAGTEAEQALFLAAGEALLAIDNPGKMVNGMGYFVSLFLVLLSGLIISFVMLRSDMFGKMASYSGILANGFALVTFPALVFVPGISWLPMSLSAPLRLIWYILIAIILFRLASKME
jgi:hypothetical protein